MVEAAKRGYTTAGARCRLRGRHFASALSLQGGLDKCHLIFYKERTLGKEGEWDNWRVEGPAFVWYFRGYPHVHVWVNVADDASPKLNSYQNSIM